MSAPLDPALASPGDWHIQAVQQRMHGGAALASFAVLARHQGLESYVGRLHPLNGSAEDLETARMNAALFAAAKPMAILLRELLDYEAAAFDTDHEVGGAGTVEWLAQFRLRVRDVMDPGGHGA